jgi:hypothetical protein
LKAEDTSTPLNREEERESAASTEPSTGWLKVAGFAAVSALAGGLAAAWWHRKTLVKLRQSEQRSANADIPVPENDLADDA